jgi:hypothetical protein
MFYQNSVVLKPLFEFRTVLYSEGYITLHSNLERININATILYSECHVNTIDII